MLKLFLLDKTVISMRRNSTTCQLKEDCQLCSHCIMLIQKHITVQRVVVKAAQGINEVLQDILKKVAH